MPSFHHGDDDTEDFAMSTTTTTTTTTTTGATGDDSLTAGAGSDTETGNDTISGAAGNDSLTGTAGNDTLSAGNDMHDDAGNDSLSGSSGNDSLTAPSGTDSLSHGDHHDPHLLTGTTGNDVFEIEHSSVKNPDTVTHIVDFTGGQDKLVFDEHLAPVTDANFVTDTAATYADALALAKSDIAAGTADVVAVQVGNDLIVFADAHDNNHVGAAAVLVGKSLGDFGPGDILLQS